MKKSLFFLLPACLHASFFTFGINGGYRYDELEVETVEEVCDKANALEVSAFATLCLIAVEAGGYADYAVALSGKRNVFWDVYGFGRLPFHLFRVGAVDLTLFPEGGYSLHHIDRDTTWEGPYAAGSAQLCLPYLYLEAGYAYHFLDTDFASKVPGQRGWAAVGFRPRRYFRVGLRASFMEVDSEKEIKTRLLKALPDIVTNHLPQGLTGKTDIEVRWRTASVLFEIAVMY